MKIIENITLDETSVGSTNAIESAAEWDSGTAYADQDIVQVAAAKRRYQSQVGSNTGNDPETDDGTNWIDIGPTNPWAMYDELSETQTERAGNITSELNATGRVTSEAFFNLDATTIRIEVEDAVEGVVYDEEFNLTSYDNVDDFYDYFFAPLIRKTDLYVDGLPPYAGATITNTISNPDSIAKCGKLVAGSERLIGETITGADFGIIDGSRITEDAFQNLTIVERSFRKRMTLSVKVARENVDETGRILASRRAIPTVFVGSDDFGQLLVDGIPREWRVVVDEYLYSILNISTEGLR